MGESIYLGNSINKLGQKWLRFLSISINLAVLLGKIVHEFTKGLNTAQW